jgi:hypothetical protein
MPLSFIPTSSAAKDPKCRHPSPDLYVCDIGIGLCPKKRLRRQNPKIIRGMSDSVQGRRQTSSDISLRVRRRNPSKA